MTGPLVADAGPLIALARVDKLGLLRRLYGQVIVPTAVQRELSIERHLPGVDVLAKALDAGWIRAQPLASRELAAVGPVLDELSRVGYWLSDRLIAEVRTRAGEGSA